MTVEAGDLWADDKEAVLAAVKSNGDALMYASKRLCNDREVVMEAITTGENAMQWASEELRSDRKFVLEAVSEDGSSMFFASEELRADREFLFEAVALEGTAFWGAGTEELLNDKELLLAAVENNSFTLAQGPETPDFRTWWTRDKEFMLEAVARNGTALMFASDRLKDDKEVVRVAAATNRDALQWASHRIRAIPVRNAASRDRRLTALFCLSKRLPLLDAFPKIVKDAGLWEDPI